MKRRRIFQVALALLASPALLRAQSARKPVRIGVLSSTSPEARSKYWDAFKEAMTKLGWLEGRDAIYIYRYTQGDPSRMNTYAAELVAEKPDLIFASTDRAALAVQRVTRELPIVFAYVPDPVASGLVASLGRPGGNATGLTSQHYELSGKYLELLSDLRPKLRRVTVLRRTTADSDRQYTELKLSALKKAIELDAVVAKDLKDLAPPFEALARTKPEAVVVLGGFVLASQQVVERMAKLRVPAVYVIDEMVTAGGLMSYGVAIAENYRRAAAYADRILKGAKPADLPVEQPVSFELVINLRAAREQGIKVPQTLLIRATRTID